MEAVLSLLRDLVMFITGLAIAAGSFFTPQLSATNPAPLPPALPTVATSTPAAASTPARATTTPAAVPASSTQKPASLPAAQPAPAPASFAPTYTTEELNTLARASLVNILCTTQNGGSFNPISGSGVIVDSRGIVLTNAHVAQYFLLRNYPHKDNVECVLRMGSPAQPRYTAELLYLPTAWITENASKISSTTPMGTGENDFAFLRITGSTNPQLPLPQSFPAIAMEAGEPRSGERMLVAAYPAGFLGGISITLSLFVSSAVATIGQLYSFSGSEAVDLFSLGGTVVSQSGSSGGAAVNTQGKLNGIIVTEVPAATTAGRDLRALTLAHINRSLLEAGQGGVLGLLGNDAAQFAAAFNARVAPAQTKALIDALGN